MYMIIPSWQFMESWPEWRLREMITIFQHHEEEGNSSNIIERSILSVINRILKEIKPD